MEDAAKNNYFMNIGCFNLQSYKTVAVVVAISSKAINNFTLLLGGSNLQPLDSKSHTGFARKMVGGKLYDTPTSEDFGLLKSLAITWQMHRSTNDANLESSGKNQLKCELIISIFPVSQGPRQIPHCPHINQISIFSYTPNSFYR